MSNISIDNDSTFDKHQIDIKTIKNNPNLSKTFKLKANIKNINY